MSQFMSWFSMGNYTLYVWSAYAMAFSVFLIHVIGIKRKQWRVSQQLQEWFKR